MTELRQDIGHAIRLLRRAPGFSALAIATLALGIAATTSIFTIVDAVLLRPLRFPEPHQLTMLLPSSGSRLSEEYFHDWRAESQTFDDMAAWYDERANMTGRGEPVEVLVDRVTSNFFDDARVPPVAGRTFTTEASLGNEPPEVVLSYGFWQRRYGGDRRDRSNHDARRREPHDRRRDACRFRGAHQRAGRIARRGVAVPPGRREPQQRDGRMSERDRPARAGRHVDRAQAELSVIARRIEAQDRSYSSDWRITVVPLLDATVRDVRLMLLVLFGGVAILLVTACVNVANLVLSRSAARATEFAVRRSLGATSGRLARQLLTEAAVLSMLGGTLAIVLAIWGTDVLVSLVPAGLDLPRTREIGVSARMLLFALLVTSLTAMLLGLVPSLGSARSAAAALRETARGSSGSLRRSYAGSALIVSEVALALVLLAGAGLLSRSFWELARVAPGFQSAAGDDAARHASGFKYDTDEKIRGFSRDLFERIERLPGMQAVGSVGYLPMSNIGIGDDFEIVGRPPVAPDGDRPTSWISTVGGRYFEAMRIRLIRGRFPGNSDTEKTQAVFVIDEELARKYWAGQDPIGARLIWREKGEVKLAGEVIGIVGGVRWAGRVNSAQPTAYFWFPQDPGREINIAARAEGDPARLAALIAAQVREIDPNQPLGEVRAMEDFVSADLARPRFTMLLLSAFAVRPCCSLPSAFTASSHSG